MNIKKHFLAKKEQFRMLHSDPLLVKEAGSEILSWLPVHPSEYITVFIGTDRATGDSLGPLAGTFFREKKPRHITTYGTLREPIHAKNLVDHIKLINKKHDNPFIIAIDACLGRSNSIGHIIIDNNPLMPGTALKKDLPSIGNMNITGVVNINGFMDFAILQNTRLSIVYDMALQIANILDFIDQKLICEQPKATVLSHHASRENNRMINKIR